MTASMRDVSRLRWLSGRLWGITLAAVFLVLYDMMPWQVSPHMSFSYLYLSRLGVLTTATIERNKSFVGSSRVYLFTTPDGARHQGKLPGLRRNVGDEVLVYYLPDDPEASIPRDMWMEVEQLGIAVLVVLSCATSLLARMRRRPA
jgi:hypothetical protein